MNTQPATLNIRAILVLGLLAIVFQVALGSILMAHLDPVPGIIVPFVLIIPLSMIVVNRKHLLRLPCIVIFAMVGTAPAMIIDVPLWGRVMDVPEGEPVTINTTVAGYTMPDWRIETQFKIEEPLSAGRGNPRYGHRQIAPLVQDGWMPSEPVKVWVAAETRVSGRVVPWHPVLWSEANGEYVRLTGQGVTGAQLAAKRAAKKHELKCVEKPLIVMRVASVADVQYRQYRKLGTVILIASVVWCILLAIIVAIRRHRSVRANSWNG